MCNVLCGGPPQEAHSPVPPVPHTLQGPVQGCYHMCAPMRPVSALLSAKLASSAPELASPLPIAMHAVLAGMGSLVLSVPVCDSFLCLVRFFRDVFFTLSLRTLLYFPFFLSVVNKYIYFIYIFGQSGHLTGHAFLRIARAPQGTTVSDPGYDHVRRVYVQLYIYYLPGKTESTSDPWVPSP